MFPVQSINLRSVSNLHNNSNNNNLLNAQPQTYFDTRTSTAYSAAIPSSSTILIEQPQPIQVFLIFKIYVDIKSQYLGNILNVARNFFRRRKIV